MGVAARRRCSPGLTAATASTDTTAPDVDDHLAGRRRRPSRSGTPVTVTAPPPTPAAAGRRRRGLHRQRRDLAPGHRPRSWTYTFTPSAVGPDLRSAAGPPTTAPTSGAVRGRHGHRRHRVRRPARARSGRAPRRPAAHRPRHQPGRARREVPRRAATASSPASASTSPAEPPAPTSAPCGPPPAPGSATVTFTNETASGWQQATLRHPDPGHRRHDLRRLLLRPVALLRQLRATSRPPRPPAAR